MDREVIATGITVDEAIEAACEKLGAPRESVDIEVLEMPKKKFFGLKTVPAKVKAVLQSEYANKFIPKEPKKTENKPKEQPQKRSVQEIKDEKPAVKQEKTENPAEKISVEQKKEKPKQKAFQPQQKKEPPKKEAAKEDLSAEVSEKEEPAKPEAKDIDPKVLEL